MLDLDDIAEVVAGAVREATTPLLARIDALEKREPPVPEKGEPGEPGPKGDPGPAGEVDMDAVKALIDAAVASLPPAERGEKGEPGQDVDEAVVAKRIDEAVAAAVSALPVPKDGEAGKDGVGLADALIDKDGSLILTMTDGRTKNLGPVNGKDGENGKDGITPTFIDAEFIGRTLRLSFDEGRVCEFKLAVPEYCGTFKQGEAYEPGDMVSWGGSVWHCDEAKGLKPDAPDSGWTLAVKRGRDGKDAPK